VYARVEGKKPADVEDEPWPRRHSDRGANAAVVRRERSRVGERIPFDGDGERRGQARRKGERSEPLRERRLLDPPEVHPDVPIDVQPGDVLRGVTDQERVVDALVAVGFERRDAELTGDGERGREVALVMEMELRPDDDVVEVLRGHFSASRGEAVRSRLKLEPLGERLLQEERIRPLARPVGEPAGLPPGLDLQRPRRGDVGRARDRRAARERVIARVGQIAHRGWCGESTAA